MIVIEIGQQEAQEIKQTNIEVEDKKFIGCQENIIQPAAA
jgi:hypothetical protein